jgi:hypothetical protein
MKLLLAAVLLPAITAALDPTILWASQPCRPDETVLVQGMALGSVKSVHIEIHNTTQAYDAATTEMTDSGLHFIVPPQLAWPAVYAITPVGAAEPFLLNTPRVQWIQGDQGRHSIQGGWFRVFGSCLSLLAADEAPSPGAVVVAEQALRRALDRRDSEAVGHFSRELSLLQANTDKARGKDVQIKLQPADSSNSIVLSSTNASEYSAFFLVPPDFSAGEYTVSIRAAHTNGAWYPIEWFQSKTTPRTSTWHVVAAKKTQKVSSSTL